MSNRSEQAQNARAVKLFKRGKVPFEELPTRVQDKLKDKKKADG